MQLDPLDVEKTHKIVHVRIHEERVIGCVRQKYILLQINLLIEFLSTANGESVSRIAKVCTVCYALPMVYGTMLSWGVGGAEPFCTRKIQIPRIILFYVYYFWVFHNMLLYVVQTCSAIVRLTTHSTFQALVQITINDNWQCSKKIVRLGINTEVPLQSQTWQLIWGILTNYYVLKATRYTTLMQYKDIDNLINVIFQNKIHITLSDTKYIWSFLAKCYSSSATTWSILWKYVLIRWWSVAVHGTGCSTAALLAKLRRQSFFTYF